MEALDVTPDQESIAAKFRRPTRGGSVETGSRRARTTSRRCGRNGARPGGRGTRRRARRSRGSRVSGPARPGRRARRRRRRRPRCPCPRTARRACATRRRARPVKVQMFELAAKFRHDSHVPSVDTWSARGCGRRTRDVPNRLLDEDVLVAHEDDPDDARAHAPPCSTRATAARRPDLPVNCPSPSRPRPGRGRGTTRLVQPAWWSFVRVERADPDVHADEALVEQVTGDPGRRDVLARPAGSCHRGSCPAR